MAAKPVAKKEFMTALSKWNRCYIKKPKSWQKVWLWWEKSKHNPKEQWFMNIAKTTRTATEPSTWIIASDIEDWFSHMERDGYKYYIDE